MGGKDPDILPNMIRLSWAQTIILHLLTPYYIISCAFRGLFLKKQDNPIAGKKLSGKRIGHLTKSFDFMKIREVCKAKGISWNDAYMSICATTFARYFESQGDTHTKEIITFTPFSLRQKGDMTLKNAVSSLVFPLEITKDFNKSL